MSADESRRLFIRHSVAAAIALPGLAMAQAPAGTRRVATMISGDPAAASHLSKALADGLAELGWLEGRNLQLDVRYGENDAARFRRLADELMALRPDVFVAANEPVARVVAPLTNTVPIVVPLGFDLVGSGLVRSLASPGGNVTGFSMLAYELMPKRLALLKEAAPGIARIGLLHRPEDANLDRVQKILAEPARKSGLAIVLVEVRDAADLDRALAQAVRQKARGLVTAVDSFFYQHRVAMAGKAIKHGLAYASGGIEYAMAGSLFSYGANFAALFRRSGALVDKILKGAKPANIPVEQASVYEFAVNLKTARALGIKLPPSFLLQATQTIE